MSHTSPAFASVAAAFDFEHHTVAPTRPRARVLKSVLIQEGLLGKLWDFAERVNVTGTRRACRLWKVASGRGEMRVDAHESR